MSWKVTADECTPEAWNELVDRRGCIYQSWDFAACLEEGLRQRIVRLSVVDEQGAVHAALPLAVIKSPLFGRFAVSLPVSDHAGVVADDADALRALLEFLPSLLSREGIASIELRHFAHEDSFPAADHPDETGPGDVPDHPDEAGPGGGPDRPDEAGPGGVPDRPSVAAPPFELPFSEHKITLELPLPSDPQELWTSLKAKVRNLVRKGEKAQLSYQQGGSEFLDEFYRVYARNLRDLGTPCYPKAFFAALLRHFPEASRIHLASMGGEGPVIAVGFTLRDGRRQQIPFAASVVEYRRHSPNMFLYWKMLEDAIARGCTVFDFGRSTRDSGTHRFKKQWGAAERPLRWYYQLVPGEKIPQTRVDSPKYRLAVRAWKRLPVGLATGLSARLVRYLP